MLREIGHEQPRLKKSVASTPTEPAEPSAESPVATESLEPASWDDVPTPASRRVEGEIVDSGDESKDRPGSKDTSMPSAEGNGQPRPILNPDTAAHRARRALADLRASLAGRDEWYGELRNETLRDAKGMVELLEAKAAPWHKINRCV